MDAQHAALGQFGSRVAHGSLLISIAIGLGSMDVPQPNLVGLVGTNWRFLKPVRPGTTVHAVWRLGRKREVTNPRWGLAVWQIELLDQSEERVLEGEVTVLVNRRQAAAAAAAPARSRRRRRGKAAAAPLPAPPTAEANLPEPAPADTPAPARRRRRSSKAAPVEALPESAPAAEPPAPPSPSRRRRRRRGGSGGGGNGSGGAQPVAAEPAPPAEPPRSQWAAPESPAPAPAPAPTSDNSNPVSRVLGRLRRSRRAAPAPGGTRSPSE